jgi:hypothetical protein
MRTPGCYAADRENNIGKGGKYQKNELRKTQNQSYEVFGLQRETYVKVVTRPAHH